MSKIITINSLNRGNLETPDSYIVCSVAIGNNYLEALIDTGAQPCVIKRSYVPEDSIISKVNWKIKGVQGPVVDVDGVAQFL